MIVIHIYRINTLPAMLFVMISGDLNIDLTKKKIFTKILVLSTNYQTPFAVCRYDSWFSGFEGGEKPPRYRAFQSQPGIGLRRKRQHRQRMLLNCVSLSELGAVKAASETRASGRVVKHCVLLYQR